MMKNAFLARDTIYYEKLGLQKNVELWDNGNSITKIITEGNTKIRARN